MIRISNVAVVLEPLTAQHVLILTDAEKKRVLPLIVSLGDSNNVNVALCGIKTVRPQIHDVLLDLFEQVAEELEEIVIDVEKERGFFAAIKHNHKSAFAPKTGSYLIANPADAIVLAIRGKVPLFITEEAMSYSVPLDPAKDAEEREKFRAFVKDLKASDFKIEGLSNCS